MRNLLKGKPVKKLLRSNKNSKKQHHLLLLGLIFCLTVGGILFAQNTGAFSLGKLTNNLLTLNPTPTPQPARPKRNTKTKVKLPGQNDDSESNRSGFSTSGESNLARILASADFNLIGLVGTVTPPTQVVPKNVPTAVLTSIQVPEGEDAAAIIAQLNPNYRIRGELTGPSFTSPRMVDAPIGQAITIPAMPNAGDHVLQNLRIVDITDPTHSPLAPVNPDSVGITVIENILVTQVQVTEMTYDQIIQSGINLNNSNYNYFNFVLGLGTSSGTVPIQIPVALPTTGGQPPVVGNPSGGVGVGGIAVPLPDIVPIMLEAVDEEGNNIPIPTGGGGGTMQIPGVVVFPGRIGLLHQFFEAIVIVANGAPNGAPLVITNLRATSKLPDAGTPNDPTDDPLRIAETQQGGVQTQLEIHGLGPDGRYGTADDTTSFNPGQSGQAAFLLEGLKEGLHTVNFDLEGTLQGLPGGNVTVRGSVPGAVLVRDAQFGVTFTHPAVVRAGQEYDLGLTVFNSGNRNISGIVLNLGGNSISGADLVDTETEEKTLTQTIPPGGSGTVKWRLRSNTTGQVTASYVKVGNGIAAGLNLVTGVGDRNVPLSPDSLILPEPVRHLPPEVVEAARQMLGQAWSVATAPSGSLPAGVLPVDKQTVVGKAVELGWAGLRVEFHEDRDTSLRTLLRDWLGENQSNSSSGFADALRNTTAGNYFYDVVGTKFYESLATETPFDFHKKLVDAESSRSSFISAVISQPNGQQIAGAKIISPSNQSVGFGANASERFGDLRTGAALNLLQTDPHNAANNTRGNLLLVSKPASGNWSLELTGWTDGNADVSILAPTSGKNYRQLIFSNVAVTAGKRYRITFKSSGTTAPIIEEFVNGAFQPVNLPFTSTELTDPIPVITGVVQITEDVIEGGDKYGRLVGILFSKPMVKSSVESAGRYQIGGGELVADPSQIVGRRIKPTASIQNFGERFSVLALDAPVGPFIKRNVTANGIVDKSGKVIANSTQEIEMRVSPRGIPPGGYMTGRVMQADGTPVPNAGVYYRNLKSPCSFLSGGETVGFQKADANGEFAFDYVREGDCNPVTVLFQNPATNSEKTLVSNVAYNGQHLIFNGVFLARGNVQGTVTSGGVPLANAYVSILSELDPLNNKLVTTNAQGFYSATGVPVGGITVKAVGTGAYSLSSGIAAGNIGEPGETTTINVSTQNISGVIKGKVLDNGNGQNPVANSVVIARANIPGFPNDDGPIAVGYSFTQEDGTFTIERLPIGTVYLEAIDPQRGISTSATVNLTGQNREVEGVILLISNGFGRVFGKVVNEIGQVIANAVVQEGAQAVRADSAGNYILPQTREGNVTIGATDPVTRQSGSTTISVRRNEDTTGADIIIRRPANLNGQVFVTENGTTTPLAGAYVSTNGLKIVRTDAQGRYSLSDVQSGTNLTLRFVHPQGRLFVNTEVFLNPGETLSRNAAFRPGKIHGRITQPNGVTPVAAGVSLATSKPHLNQDFLFGLPEPVSLSYQTTSDGLYSFENLNPENYHVSTSNAFFPVTVSQSGILPPNADLEVNLSLVDTLAGKVKGHIFQPDGTTPVGAGVKVSLGGGSLADVTVRTNAEGYYEFAEVFAQGNYILTATDPVTNRTNRTGVDVRKNTDIEIDLRLLGRGNLKVRAIDGSGNPLQTGSIKVEGAKYPFDQKYVELTSGSNGEFEFTNLTEGTYAVSALYNNLGGRVSGRITTDTTTEVTVQVQAVGRVTGRVFMPDGTTPVGLADVSLMQNGRIIGLITTQDSEEERGKFEFGYVPTGDFTIEVFDNRSGRRGRSAGTITGQGQTANVNVNLLALGTVAGRVTANGVPAAHVLVNLNADGSGIDGTSRAATTDSNGDFRFPGVPVGRIYVSVYNGPGGTNGSAQGIVLDSPQPLVLDIALTPTASVAGTVYKSGGTEVYSGALVRVTSNYFSANTVTDENGRYRVDFLPLGTVNVKVESPFGYDRGKSAAIVSNQPGATVTANVVMAGVGNIGGTALDSGGNPLALGKVTFTNTAWNENISVVAPVQPDGSYSLTGLPAGEFNLKLTVPEIIGVGTAAGNLTGGQTLAQNLQLDAAGKVFGSVIATDGTTPAVGADVTLTLVRPNYVIHTFVTHTDSTGNWAIDSLPLGTVSIRISDANSGGSAALSGLSLSTNGQQLDTGSVTLQNAPLSVASVIPADYSGNVPVNTAVQIIFSEPIDADTVTSDSVRLNLGNDSVGVVRTVSPDGLIVKLTPEQNLAEAQTYKVVVSTQIRNRTGSPLPNQFSSNFVTALTNTDNTPPGVVAVTPSYYAVQVAVNSVVTVRFNEPLNPNQDFATILKVKEFSQTSPENGTYSLSEDGKTITFTPAGLATDKHYVVSVNGQKDLRGNTQTQVYSSVFTTIDTIAPAISEFKINGRAAVNGMTISTPRPTFDVYYEDELGIDTDNVKLYLYKAGTPALEVSAQIYNWRLYYRPADTLLSGNYIVKAVITDFAGNQAAGGEFEFNFAPQQPEILSVSDTYIPSSGNTIATITGSQLISGVGNADNSQTGLLAEYFECSYNGCLENIKLVRRDETVNLDTFHESVVPFIYGGSEVVRWRGTIVPRFTETYTLKGRFNGNFVVKINGQTIVNGYSYDVSEASGVINLEAGRNYDVEILSRNYYFDYNGYSFNSRRVTQFLWSSASQESEIVPAAQLHPAGTPIAPTVTVGGQPAVVIGAVAGETDQLAVIMPPHAEGSADVQVQNENGTAILSDGIQFYTDVDSPSINTVSPRNGTVNVVPERISVTFDEPLNAGQNPGEILKVYKDSDNTEISGQVTIDETFRRLRFVPSNPFETNITYRIVARGHSDTIGNINNQDLVSRFTVDNIPPDLVFEKPGASTLARRPEITIGLNDSFSPLNLQSARLFVDGADVSNRLTINYPCTYYFCSPYRTTYGITYFPQTDLSLGAHTVQVQIADQAGNLADRTFIFTVAPDQEPPTVSETYIADRLFTPGLRTAQRRPSFAIAFNDNGVINDSSQKLFFGPQGGNLVQVNRQVFRSGSWIMRYTPPQNVPFGFYSYRYELVDGSGNRTIQTINFEVADLDITPPYVTAVTPQDGTVQVDSNTPVTLTFSEPLDPNQNFTDTIRLSNGSYEPVSGTYQLDSAGTTLTFTPAEPLPENSKYYVYAYGYLDVAGNGGYYFNSSFATNDNVPPFVSDAELYITTEDQWIILNGAETFDRNPLISINYGDTTNSINPDSIVFTLDGQTVSSGVYPWAVRYQPETPLSYGQHTITFQVADTIGNVSELKTETFSVLKDPRTPFVVEPDTTLLWRLNETGSYNNSQFTPDAGDYRIDGIFPQYGNLTGLQTGEKSVKKPAQAKQDSGQKTAQKTEAKNGETVTASSSLYPTQRGRFGGSLSSPNLTSLDDQHLASIGNAGFTVEGWMKAYGEEVSEPYTVWAKGGDSAKDFELLLTPAGNLIARLYNSNNESVEIEMPKETYNVTDEQWHSVAMTVEADGNIPAQLKLYVDGQLRAGLPVPQNFGTVRNRGGKFYLGFGNNSFYSTFDEIRISSTAHSAETISKTYNSIELGLIVTRLNSSVIPSGNTSDLIIEGYNLDSVTELNFTDLSGNPIPITAAIAENSKIRIKTNLTVDASVPNGDVRINLTDGQTVVSRNVRVAAQQPFTADAGTLMLFNMNEPHGETVINSGTLGGFGDNYQSYEAVTGRYGNGRRAIATSQADLTQYINSSFTTEFWLKPEQPEEDLNLLVYGADFIFSSFNENLFNNRLVGLTLSPRGELKAILTDDNRLNWTTATQIGDVNLLNEQWHLVSMVVTRGAQPAENVLKIYIDGAEKASAIMPSGFAAMTADEYNRVYLNRFDYSPNPGNTDDFRFLSYARTASEIQNTWLGINNYAGIGILLPKQKNQPAKQPKAVETDKTATPVDNVAATLSKKPETEKNYPADKKTLIKNKFLNGNPVPRLETKNLEKSANR